MAPGSSHSDLSEDFPWSALDRYVSGRGTPEDIRAVEGAFAETTVGERGAEVYRQWMTSRQYPAATSPDFAWERVRQAIDRTQADIPRSLAHRDVAGGRHLTKSATKGRGIYGVSALIGAVLTIGVVFHHVPQSTASAVGTYHTAAGQYATVTLPNAAQIQIGPATQMVVTMGSDPQSIDVTLAGEARFSVTQRRDVPFRIHTSSAITSVLGTTFFVRQYATEERTSVFVTDGRVSVRGRSPSVTHANACVLTAGTRGIVDDSGRVLLNPEGDPNLYAGWTHGELVFHRTPVRDVVDEVGRAYGVDVRVTDSALAARTLTWTLYVPQQSLTTALNALAEVLSAHPVRMGQTITLVPGTTATQAPARSRPSSTSVIREHLYGR